MLVAINSNCPAIAGGCDDRDASAAQESDGHHPPGAPAEIRPAIPAAAPPRSASSPNVDSWRCVSRTSAPPPTSAARRSTGTSPTRKRCWSSCWWRSAPACWPADEGGRRAGDPAAALDGLIDFHLDFAFGEPDLIRIQDRDLIHLPAAATRQVRGSQRQYVEIWVRVLRRAGPGLDEADARLMAHATFGLMNSTPHSAKPPVGNRPACAPEQCCGL